MKKFKLYIILIAIFLLILFLAIIAFYSIPYTKCNSLIHMLKFEVQKNYHSLLLIRWRLNVIL